MVTLPAIKLHEKRGSHWYEIEGQSEFFPSVTTVISATLPKPALAAWHKKATLEKVQSFLSCRDNLPLDIHSMTQEKWDMIVIDIKDKISAYTPQITQVAADFGTRAHKTIERYLKGEAYAVDDDIKPSFEGFKQWVLDNHIDIDRSEQRLFSLDIKTAGSADIIGRRNGKRIIADIKTSKGCWPDFAYQIAGGYGIMWDELFGDTEGYIEEAWVVRLPKTASEEKPFEAKRIVDIKLAQRAFRRLREQFNIRNFKWFEDVDATFRAPTPSLESSFPNAPEGLGVGLNLQDKS